MDEKNIICPHCKQEIKLSQSIIGHIEESMRGEYETCLQEREEQLKKKENEIERSLKEVDSIVKASVEEEKRKIKDEMDKEAKEKYRLEMTDLKEKLKERDCQIKEIEKEELDLRKRERELEERQKKMDMELSKMIEKEKEIIRSEIEKKVSEKLSIEMKDLEDQLIEKEKKLKMAREEELKLRKKQRELEEREESLELDVQRKMDSQRKEIEMKTMEKIQNDYLMKEKEKDKTITDLKEQIEHLRRTAGQGSQQQQGEVLELSLEDELSRAFPYDEIEEVKKGQRGADLVQKVMTNTGQPCGTILWETKRAKNWSNDWITKLKDDQREKSADIAVLCTTILPKEINDFKIVNGIVVTTTTLALPIASFLRNQLIDIARLKRSSQGRKEKKEMLYSYLTGTEFRQSVEGIAEAFFDMKSELEREKTHALKTWKKREKQMERALKNLIEMYGSMQGIAGASIPEIKTLEVERITERSGNGGEPTLDEY